MIGRSVQKSGPCSHLDKRKEKDDDDTNHKRKPSPLFPIITYNHYIIITIMVSIKLLWQNPFNELRNLISRFMD